MWSTILTAGTTLLLGAAGLWLTFRKNNADLEALRQEHAREKVDQRQRELERQAAAESDQRAMFDKRVMDYIDGLERRLKEVVDRNRDLEARVTANARELEAARLEAHQLRDRVRDLERPAP